MLKAYATCFRRSSPIANWMDRVTVGEPMPSQLRLNGGPKGGTFGPLMLRVVVAFLTCISVAALCVAQDGNARLVGRVLFQPEGTGFPGVTIVATSGDVRREVTTGGDGRYEIRDLRPGAYTITASLPGFRTETRPIELHASETQTADFALRIGCPSPAITVSSHTTFFAPQLAQMSDMVADLLIQERRGDIPSDPECSLRFRAKVLRALKNPMSGAPESPEFDLFFDRVPLVAVEPGRYLAWLSWRADRNAFVILGVNLVWPIVGNQVKYDRLEPQMPIDELFQIIRQLWPSAVAR
jgi:Carboxypeptidase regulatory-like domain